MPNGRTVLLGFSMDKSRSENLWREPSQRHPLVMYEDVLYAVGQQRFKIFRIRTFLVLGWSADGLNLFVPAKGLATKAKVAQENKAEEEEKPHVKSHSKFTWYRRVLCAIPNSLSSSTAILVWPRPWNLRHHLTVILFPKADSKEISFPKVIFSPLTPVSLQSDDDWKDENHDYKDGWLRGHAFECPYHLKL